MGKDNKKKKNKKKELNMKGNKSVGSDMDAFIDDNSTTETSTAQPPQTVVAMETETQSPVAMETREAPGSEPKKEPVALETQAPGSELQKEPDALETQAPGSEPQKEPVALETQAPGSEPQKAPVALETQAPAVVRDDSQIEVVETASVQSVAMVTEVVDVNAEMSQSTDNVTLGVDAVTDASTVTDTTDTSTVTDTTDTPPVTADTPTVVAATDDAARESVEGVDMFKQPTGLPPGTKAQQEVKYKYAEEQWSPLNPEGKKQYDRSFMLQLQFAQTSLTRPANLPQLPDIILTEGPQRTDITRTRSMELRRGEPNPVDFTPGFIKSSPSGSRRPPHVQRSISGNKKQQEVGGASSGGRKIISVQLQHDVKLHTTENAWKPIINKKDVDDETAQTQELYKKVRGILNKLTPQKFKTLIQQVLTLPINTEQRLKGCIDIIFEKAISEPNFSVAYANMAKCMLTLTVPRDSDATQSIGFRSLLLNKCQQEFEKDKAEELDIAERQKLIDEATSEDKRKLLVEEQEQAASRAKRRSLGNIRFIGELFKLRMLTETIMHDCLFKLLRSYDEDNLECLCQLLTTIGQDLDNKQAKLQPRVDKYFQQLDILVADRKTSARIRFMLLDTIDLRKNNWIPRREKNNPKTIEQIHKEAQEEAQEKHAAIQRASMEQRGRRTGPGGMMGGRAGPPAAGLVGEDGWTSVSRPPRNVAVDPCRLKLTKREQVDDNIQLGPGGRGLSTWHRGSSGGGGKVTTPEPDIRQPNRYSLLERGASGASEVSDSSRRNVASNRAYQGRMSGPAATNTTTRAVRTQQQQHDIDERGRREFVSPMSSRSVSRESTTRPTDAAASVPVTPVPAAAISKEQEQELSDDEIEKKTKSIMEEYLHLNDINEAVACVRELNLSKSMHMFVYYALILNLERSLQARQMTGLLLHELIRLKVLTLEQYVSGLQQVLSLADDMVIDVPMIWQYVGELISPMIQLPTTGSSGTTVPATGTVVPLVFLRTACQPLLECVGGDKAAVVVAIVIKDAVHRLGHHTVAELWQNSQLQWTDFLPEDKVDGFLQATDVLFTVTMKPVTNSERKQSSSDELVDLLSNLDIENEQVIDWIDENVTEINESFIRLLTTAICKPAWKVGAGCSARPEDIDVSLIKRRVALLQKYVNHRTEFELESLFAVQLIVNDHGHPFGALRIFFDLLYDDEIVSEESFYLWRDKPEIGEQTGRGCATMALDQFYKWLEEDTTPTSS